MDRENNKTEVFESLPVPKAMMVMAIPTIMSQLITLVYNLADTWFIGLTNNPYMVAACSLVLPAFMITVVISNIFGVGGGTLVSRLLGSKNEPEARKVASISLYMAGGAALTFSCFCLLFRDGLLKLLGASENTLGFARDYLFFVVILGGCFAVLSGTMSSIIRSIGYSKEASLGLMLGGILNIALDPLFMYVIMPDGKQVMGAAIATMLSNLFSFLFFLRQYKRLNRSTILTLAPERSLPSRTSFASIFAVGIPAAFALLMFDLTNIFINRLSAGHGDVELAAIGIVLKAERLPLNTGVGICMGMVPLIAYNYSGKNYGRLREVFRFGRMAGLLVSFVCVILYRHFAGEIMELFIRDAATVAYGTEYLKARCLATPLMFLCFSMVHFMEAIGKGKQAFLLAVVRQLLFNIPLLHVLNHLYGMTGIVWTQAVADFFTVIVSYLVYMRVCRAEGI